MRAERLAIALLCAATVAAGDEPDPTKVLQAPSATQASPPAPGFEDDPCGADPRCRIARLRAERARLHRAQYLRLVEEQAREMDKRIEKAKPFRTRFPFEVDFVLWFSSKTAMPGALLAYAPLWWLKTEAWAAHYDSNTYNYDTTTQSSRDAHVTGASFGTQMRFTPVKFALSPYASIGWQYLTGSVTTDIYNGSNYDTKSGDAASSLLNIGVGLALVVPYFHFSIGYQFAYAFSSQAVETVDPTQRNPSSDTSVALKGDVQYNLDQFRHLAVLEIGCAF